MPFDRIPQREGGGDGELTKKGCVREYLKGKGTSVELRGR